MTTTKRTTGQRIAGGRLLPTADLAARIDRAIARAVYAERERCERIARRLGHREALREIESGRQ